MNRREILKGFVHVFFSSLLLLFTGVLFFAYPTKKTQRQVTYIPVLDEEELPHKHLKTVHYTYTHEGKTIVNKVYILPNEDGYIALSPVCSHLGCLVKWDSLNKEFICPCHSGRYNILGEVVGGPPTKPLTRLPVNIENGKVYVGFIL